MGINRSKFKNQIRASRNRKSMISSNATTWIQQRFLFYFVLFLFLMTTPRNVGFISRRQRRIRGCGTIRNFFFPTPVSFYLLFVCLRYFRFRRFDQLFFKPPAIYFGSWACFFPPPFDGNSVPGVRLKFPGFSSQVCAVSKTIHLANRFPSTLVQWRLMGINTFDPTPNLSHNEFHFLLAKVLSKKIRFNLVPPSSPERCRETFPCCVFLPLWPSFDQRSWRVSFLITISRKRRW